VRSGRRNRWRPGSVRDGPGARPVGRAPSGGLADAEAGRGGRVHVGVLRARHAAGATRRWREAGAGGDWNETLGEGVDSVPCPGGRSAPVRVVLPSLFLAVQEPGGDARLLPRAATAAEPAPDLAVWADDRPVGPPARRDHRFLYLRA